MLEIREELKKVYLLLNASNLKLFNLELREISDYRIPNPPSITFSNLINTILNASA